jgi:hypothetical protein
MVAQGGVVFWVWSALYRGWLRLRLARVRVFQSWLVLRMAWVSLRLAWRRGRRNDVCSSATASCNDCGCASSPSNLGTGVGSSPLRASRVASRVR